MFPSNKQLKDRKELGKLIYLKLCCKKIHSQYRINFNLLGNLDFELWSIILILRVVNFIGWLFCRSEAFSKEPWKGSKLARSNPKINGSGSIVRSNLAIRRKIGSLWMGINDKLLLIFGKRMKISKQNR